MGSEAFLSPVNKKRKCEPPPPCKLDDVVAPLNIRCIDFFAENASEEFTRSLKETGFAVLKTHTVDWALIEAVYEEWREFLKSLHEQALRENISNSSSSEEKHKIYRADAVPSGQDGYFPQDVSEIAKGCKLKDMKHYWHMYFPWGRFPTGRVSDNVRKLFDELTKLGLTLLEWIEKHMSPECAKRLKQPLTESWGMEQTLLRILHYPEYVQGTEELGAVRAAAHEDINLITVLPTGSSRGLEVYSRLEKKWYEVPVHDQSIVVNIGDMLQEMTGGEYVATTHRVVKPRDECDAPGRLVPDRMATPCFMHAKKDAYISENYPTMWSFLEERLKQNGVL